MPTVNAIFERKKLMIFKWCILGPHCIGPTCSDWVANVHMGVLTLKAYTGRMKPFRMTNRTLKITTYTVYMETYNICEPMHVPKSVLIAQSVADCRFNFSSFNSALFFFI